MNWNAIGAVGEVAGAIAVVATLVYLTIQLRINTKSIVSSNSNNLMQGFNTFNASLYGDEEATRIFYDGLESPDTLSLTERRRFLHMALCLINIYRNIHQQYLEGTFPPDAWEPIEREAQQILATPGFLHLRAFTKSYETLYEYMDRLPPTDGPIELFAGRARNHQ